MKIVGCGVSVASATSHIPQCRPGISPHSIAVMVPHWQRSSVAQQCGPRHSSAVVESRLSPRTQLQPSEVGTQVTALQAHSSAGPGHALGAQQRVRG